MIISATFTANGAIDAIIDGVAMSVPDDMANRHRQMIAAWEADGNVIAPYLPPDGSVVYRLYKSTFVRRMSIAEAELFESGILAQPAWMRLLYNSVEYFVSSDALIQALNAELAFALGELLGDPLAGQVRADELLGPPTVQEAAALVQIDG